MRWAIKHKSGRTLFVTSDEFIANNRRKMGWIVEEVKMTSREQFEQWLYQQRVRGSLSALLTSLMLMERFIINLQTFRVSGMHGRHHARRFIFKRANAQTIMVRMLMTIIASKLITQA